MAEEQAVVETEATTEEPKAEPEPKPELKYTDDDVDRIVNQKFAKWQKDQEAKVAEAQKLAEMSATEKSNYELEQSKKELSELKHKVAVSEMTTEARKQLAEQGVDVSDDLVTALIRDDAEQTKASIDAFAETFKAAVETAVTERLKGTPPKSGSSAKAMTKKDIEGISNPIERQAAIRAHLDLFEGKQ